MPRILIADDCPESRELVREILEPAGYEVLEARDGLEAIECARRASPDLLLLDLLMPAVDGFEVLRQLRADPQLRGLRAIALTAHAMEQDRERALRAGFDGYVTKPIRAAELRKQLNEFFARRAAGAGAGGS